jgi:tol-pal system protein YbgF
VHSLFVTNRPGRVGLLFASLFLPACWVGLEQGRRMEVDLARLKSDAADVRKAREQDAAHSQREVDQLRREHDVVAAHVRKLLETVDGLGKSSRKTGADMGIQLDKLEDEVARLKVLLDESQSALKSSSSDQAKVRAELEELAGRLVQLEGGKPSSPATDGRAAGNAGASKDDVLKSAKGKLDAGETEAARALFVDFLKRWKGDALAPAAQYGLGETYFLEKRWREAIFEYRKVSDHAPKSDKAPDALVRIGSSFVELSLIKEARLFFEEVLRSYPKAAAVKTAKAKLAALDKKK